MQCRSARERGAGGRNFRSPSGSPFSFLPQARGLDRPSMGEGCGERRGKAGVGSGGHCERLNRFLFFPLLFLAFLEEFGTKERRMDLGTGTGRWEPGVALSLFFRFFYGSYYF